MLAKKHLYIKQCEKSGKFKYFYMDSGRSANRSKSLCVFIDQTRPLLHKLYIVKLHIGKWSKLKSKVRKGLNIASEHTKDASLKIFYTGTTREQLVWN